METIRNKQVWLLPLLLAVVLACVFAIRALQPEATQVVSPTTAQENVESKERVKLTIDLGDGAPREVNAAWKAGMTVQDALATAEAVTFSVQGEGKTAFLAELAGQPNEGSGGKNWQFEVNGEWSGRSFGLHELEPGDHVLWKFTKSE